MSNESSNNNRSEVDDLMAINISTNSKKIIKVIGVGGGGSNAVIHMHKQGIHDVSFALCNTDIQALDKSNVPVKIQIGAEKTEGLGAGADPAVAKLAAAESKDEITELFQDGTKMAFITAGMGGGTGTGAAPYIAGIAKDLGVLTVGIVTIPFLFEGPSKINKALDGVEELAKNVDALLVINNERLREIYKDIELSNAFKKADDTLTIAAKSIAEIITIERTMNLDFADVKTTLKNGGIAIMSTGYGEGKNRVENAIQNALDSPLLNNSDIYNSKNIMINLDIPVSLKTEELDGLHNFMANFSDKDIDVIWGYGIDENLGEKVKIAILATGFGSESIPGLFEHQEKKEENKAALSKAEDEREKARVEQRLRAFYGKNKGVKRKAQIFIFENEDLDNDALISELEKIPTYDRSYSNLDEIRELQFANENAEDKNESTEAEESTPTNKTIQF